MDLADLREALGAGQPGYRAKQVYEAIYRRQASDLVQISTLPVRMRQDLAAQHRMGLPKVARLYQSSDGTRRYLLELEDGRTVETVLMPEGERDTICISSQVGCPVDCKFCMTALMGLERSLTAGEIVGQVLLVARENQLRQDGGRLEHRDDGPGRAAAESREGGEGHQDSAGPRWVWPVAAPHYGVDRGDHSEDCRVGTRAGAAQAGYYLSECVERRDAAGS